MLLAACENASQASVSCENVVFVLNLFCLLPAPACGRKFLCLVVLYLNSALTLFPSDNGKAASGVVANAVASHFRNEGPGMEPSETRDWYDSIL